MNLMRLIFRWLAHSGQFGLYHKHDLQFLPIAPPDPSNHHHQSPQHSFGTGYNKAVNPRRPRSEELRIYQ